MSAFQSKHLTLTLQWNVKLPLYNPSVHLEFAYTRVFSVLLYLTHVAASSLKICIFCRK